MKNVIFLLVLIFGIITSPHAADISLTIYNTDMAVIKLIDEMSFRKGVQTISYTDVAKMIDPTSVRFSPLNGNVVVLEQNYRYDLVSTRKVLQHYVDKNVSIRIKDGDLIEGILQSVDGDVLIKCSDNTLNILKSDVIERFDLPELPEGLVTRPTLFWKLNSERAVKTKTELSYITHGFSWHAEYSAVISDDEKEMEISSWVSIDNKSGAAYKDAALKLVAGDVHLVRPQTERLYRKMDVLSLAEDAARTGFEERAFFEYHLYDLQMRTTIHNAEIKQIALFDPTVVKTSKLYVYDSRKNAKKVAVNMEFMNTKKDGLGIALPAGKVRVYKRDTDKSIEFVGEDALDHTPKNEKVRLTLGHAFDLVAERKVLDDKRISPRIREQIIEISLRNRKEEKVSILVVEHFWGDWEIREKTQDYIKKDAYTAEFTVEVPPDGETVLTYTVRIK